jgi:hypothetical protein
VRFDELEKWARDGVLYVVEPVGVSMARTWATNGIGIISSHQAAPMQIPGWREKRIDLERITALAQIGQTFWHGWAKNLPRSDWRSHVFLCMGAEIVDVPVLSRMLSICDPAWNENIELAWVETTAEHDDGRKVNALRASGKGWSLWLMPLRRVLDGGEDQLEHWNCEHVRRERARLEPSAN